MIRGFTENGSLYIGLLRGPLLDKLLAGERVCLPGSRAGGPHMCLFVRDTNEELLEATKQYFPDGVLPGAVIGHHPHEPTGEKGPNSQYTEHPEGEWVRYADAATRLEQCDKGVRARDGLIAELRAEVERLRAREEQREHAWSVDVAHRHAAESSLAAATELLESLRWEPALPTFQVARIVGCLRLLAAQPAKEELASREQASAATVYTRTEADQSVLDAMRGAPEETMRTWATNQTLVASWLGELARAELARRGLK